MLVNQFLATARTYADRLAVKDPRAELSFRQMAGLADVIRGVVARETTCPRVGLMLPTTGAGMGTILGILWAGRTVVPLNFLLSSEELTRIVADSGIDLILGTAHFR